MLKDFDRIKGLSVFNDYIRPSCNDRRYLENDRTGVCLHSGWRMDDDQIARRLTALRRLTADDKGRGEYAIGFCRSNSKLLSVVVLSRLRQLRGSSVERTHRLFDSFS